MRPSQAIIDLTALRANIQQIRTYASSQHLMAVVKADAYGHGIVRVAQAIESCVDAFAVSCLDEAVKLREAGIQKPIILLEGFFHPDELPFIVEHHLQIVLHTPFQIEQLLKATLPKPIDLWLKVDTGMHRLGFSPEEVQTIYSKLRSHPVIGQAIIRLMSHLACADDYQDPKTLQQTERFFTLAKSLKIETSLANSAGIIGWSQTHGHWVRPGIMLYGVSPFSGRTGIEEGLQPVMQLKSALISVKHYSPGETIGYGATWCCPENMPVGVVAMGYADGYPRHAPAGTPVLVNGQRVPLIGRVSMDMITVDLRTQPEARIGDPVILWGKDLPIEEIATWAGTIPYELLCHVCPRVRRVEII